MTKFKVGDTVRVKSFEWYNENKDKYGNIVFSDKSKFCKSMSQFCGRFITINKIETPLLGSTWYSGLGAFCSFAYWMLEDEPVATTVSLSPPFNHPSDPYLTSHETTYLKKEESRTSALLIDATKVMTPISSKEFYNTFKPINAEQFNITENTEVKSINWQEYRFDLIKSVLPALVQDDNSAEHCAKKSIEMADEVIKLLKEERLTKDTKNVTDGIQ